MILRIALGLVVLTTLASANAKESQADCDMDATQIEMTNCAWHRLQQADSEMNRLYKQQMGKLGKNAAERLRKAT